MSEELRSILVGTAGLSVAALVALLLTLACEDITRTSTALRSVSRLTVLVILLQGLHFGEELVTGFYTRFPELLGLTAWPLGFFVSFNLVWIAVWGVSVLALPAFPRATLFPLWFLGIACVANGLAHSVFSFIQGGYFPGLLSAPLVGIAGVWLLLRLAALTAGDQDPLDAA